MYFVISMYLLFLWEERVASLPILVNIRQVLFEDEAMMFPVVSTGQIHFVYSMQDCSKML